MERNKQPIHHLTTPDRGEIEELTNDLAEQVQKDNPKVASTYKIRLCKNGKEFKSIPNVADVLVARPTAGKVIDDKWKVRRVISNSVSEIVLDVEEVGVDK